MSSECSKYVIYSETQRKGKGKGRVGTPGQDTQMRMSLRGSWELHTVMYPWLGVHVYPVLFTSDNVIMLYIY